MTPPVRIRCCIGVTLLATGWFAVLASRQRRAAEQDARAWGAKRASLLDSPAGVPASAVVPTAPEAAAPPSTLPPPLTEPSPWKLMANDPGLQARYLAARRAALPARYAPFLRRLGLSPERSARALQLIAEHDEQFFDTIGAVPGAITDMETHNSLFETLPVMAAAVGEDGQPLPPGSSAEVQAAAQMLSESEAAFKAALDATAGPNAYGDYVEYNRTWPARTMVNALGAALATTDQPLAPDAADQLVKAIAAAAPATDPWINRDAIPWDQVTPAVAAILTPTQLATFENQTGGVRTWQNLGTTIGKAGGWHAAPR